MNKHRRLIISLAIFSAIFLIGQFLFVPKSYVNSRLVQALQAPGVFFRAIFTRADLISQLNEANLVNQSLEAQISVLKNSPAIISQGNKDYLRVFIFSKYPFNNEDRVLVNAGKIQGVALGQTVLAEPSLFLGEVAKADDKISEVRTIFDPGWELPVKIGPDRINALLIGGHEVKLTMIDKDSHILSGQKVYLASRNHEYGLALGTVGEVYQSSKNLFEEAILVTPYNHNELNELFIVHE